MSLARAELTGPTMSRLGPTLQGTARRLWMIYVVLTCLEFGMLYFIGGMGMFDAANYSLTTLPSGGFGTSDGGIMAFESARVESIIMIFMLLTCINFSLLHLVLAGRSGEVWKDEELRSYLLILLLAWLAMALNLYRSAGDLGALESLRHSLFQAISISSTGYSSADFATWPVFSQFVLLLLPCMTNSGKIMNCSSSLRGDSNLARVGKELALLDELWQWYELFLPPPGRGG